MDTYAYIFSSGGGSGLPVKPYFSHFYPAALKGSGVLSYPEQAGGRAGGRADKPR